MIYRVWSETLQRIITSKNDLPIGGPVMVRTTSVTADQGKGADLSMLWVRWWWGVRLCVCRRSMIAAWDFLSSSLLIFCSHYYYPIQTPLSSCSPLSAGTSVQHTFTPIHFPLALSRNICPWQVHTAYRTSSTLQLSCDPLDSSSTFESFLWIPNGEKCGL